MAAVLNAVSEQKSGGEHLSMQNTVALAVISRHLPGDAAREEELAFRRILHELLAAGSELLSVSLPAPLVTIVNEYCQGLKWKLATGAPGINGAIERISDTSARHSGPKYQRNAFIQGDTPLSSGRHAWRVRVEGLGDYGGEVALGIVQAGREVRKHASSPCFHGIETYGVGRRWGPRSGGPLEVARYTMDSGLGEIRSGDTVDLPLDMDKRSLTAITLKDGKRCVWRGLPDMAWVPHFYLCNANNAISVEVIDPEQAGLMAKKD